MIDKIFYLLCIFSKFYFIVSSDPIVLSKDDDITLSFPDIPCDHLQQLDQINSKCKIPRNTCSRNIIDGIFSNADVEDLLMIAHKGMNRRIDVGGPTILDINTGYIRDSEGLDNLFNIPNDMFTPDDFSRYAKIIQKLKESVEHYFNIEDLYFTAPTFISRLDGRDTWKSKGIHDEYWHPHADMNNTEHYHYSGLLYLSTYMQDFQGGRLIFVNKDNYHFQENLSNAEQIVEPKLGRVVLFTAGPENTHYVEKVTDGQRFVLSFWFTCDASKKFQIFLDGHKHTEFSHRIRDFNNKKQEANKQSKKPTAKTEKHSRNEL